MFHWGDEPFLTGVPPGLLISVVRMTVRLDALVVEPPMVSSHLLSNAASAAKGT
jgi:hypothetical protein